MGLPAYVVADAPLEVILLLPPQEILCTEPVTLLAEDGTEKAETAIITANIPAHAFLTMLFISALIHPSSGMNILLSLKMSSEGFNDTLDSILSNIPAPHGMRKQMAFLLFSKVLHHMQPFPFGFIHLLLLTITLIF